MRREGGEACDARRRPTHRGLAASRGHARRRRAAWQACGRRRAQAESRSSAPAAPPRSSSREAMGAEAACSEASAEAARDGTGDEAVACSAGGAAASSAAAPEAAPDAAAAALAAEGRAAIERAQLAKDRSAKYRQDQKCLEAVTMKDVGHEVFLIEKRQLVHLMCVQVPQTCKCKTRNCQGTFQFLKSSTDGHGGSCTMWFRCSDCKRQLNFHRSRLQCWCTSNHSQGCGCPFERRHSAASGLGS